MELRIQRLSKNAITLLTSRIDRVRCLAALGRLSEASAEIRELTSKSSKSPEAWLVRATVEAIADRPPTAMEAMAQAYQLGISVDRMREEWPLRPLLKDFRGDKRPSKNNP